MSQCLQLFTLSPYNFIRMSRDDAHLVLKITGPWFTEEFVLVIKAKLGLCAALWMMSSLMIWVVYSYLCAYLWAVCCLLNKSFKQLAHICKTWIHLCVFFPPPFVCFSSHRNQAVLFCQTSIAQEKHTDGRIVCQNCPLLNQWMWPRSVQKTLKAGSVKWTLVAGKLAVACQVHLL